MREATSGNQAVKQSVAPITASHGLNPGWGVYEERPSIPAFGGAAEIGRLALMFTLWSRVEHFIYTEVGIEPLSSLKEEKKHLSILLESETYLIALLCLLNNEYYSASGLVDAMVGTDATADQRGNARKRILNRTLPVVGDHYGLIDYSERHMGNSMEYSICRSQRLVEFAESHLVTSINGMFESFASSSIKEAAPRKSVKAKGGSKKQAVAKQGRAVTGKTAKKKKVLTSGAEK